MKISQINGNQSFKNIYISSKNMPAGIQKRALNIVRGLCCTTDISERLESKGIDVYIYADRKHPDLRANVVFADKALAVYKLDGNKYATGTSFREIREKSTKDTKAYKLSSNTFDIYNYAQKILENEITEKSSDNPIADELKEIFIPKNKKYTFVFKS